MPNYIDTDHIKERHAVIIRFIRIIKEEDFGVRLEVDERIRVCEENNRYVVIGPELYTVLKTFIF